MFTVGCLLIRFSVGLFSHEVNALLVVPLVLLVRQATTAGLIADAPGRRVVGLLEMIAAGGLVSAVIAPGTVAQRDSIC